MNLCLKPKNGMKVIKVHAFILPSLTQLLPNRSFDVESQFHMRTVELADPSFNVPSAIEYILESDVADEIILDGKFTETNGLDCISVRQFSVGLFQESNRIKVAQLQILHSVLMTILI